MVWEEEATDGKMGQGTSRHITNFTACFAREGWEAKNFFTIQNEIEIAA